MRIPRGVRVGRHGPMVNSIARRIARNSAPAIPGPTSIDLSTYSFDEDAAAGSTIAFITAESDTEDATYSYALLDDADGLFEIEDDMLKLKTTLPSGEEIFLRDVTIQGTIDQTGGTSSETFTLSIEPVDTSNDSGLPAEGGTLVPVGDFTLTPSVQGNNGALKFKGKNGGLAFFVFDIGAAEPEGIYTYSYVPYFSELSNQGRDAFVGFGFKTGNNFHLAGLKGDGSTGLTKHTISGTNLNNATQTASGAPANGTQAGPNFVQIEISADGNSYTLRTSGDAGETWDDEFTAAVPTPFSDTATTEFGLAVFLENSDKGKFSLDVTEWSVAGLPSEYWEFTKSLLGFENNVTDEATGGQVWTETGGSFSTTVKKFGTHSRAGRCIGTEAGRFVLGSGPFRFDMWSLFNAPLTNQQTILSQWDVGNLQFTFRLNSSTQLLFAYSEDGSTAVNTTAAWTADTSWHLFTVARDASGTIRIFVDGVMLGKQTARGGTIRSAAIKPVLFAEGSETAFRSHIGWGDEFRAIVGSDGGLNTDDSFAVPTEPWPRT